MDVDLVSVRCASCGSEISCLSDEMDGEWFCGTRGKTAIATKRIEPTPLQSYQTAIYALLESAAKELGVHEFEVLAGTVGYRLYHMTQVATRGE